MITIQLSSLFFTSEYFNAFNFGYVYIIGVLAIFMYGYAFSRRDILHFFYITICVWLLFAAFLFIVAPYYKILGNPSTREVLTGGFIALPLGYLFTKAHFSSAIIKKIDMYLGDLAYPVFLSHMLSLYLAEKMFLISPTDTRLFCLTSIIICLLFSLILQLIQAHIETYRIKIRQFGSLRTHGRIV
jgi:hypothetical protein